MPTEAVEEEEEGGGELENIRGVLAAAAERRGEERSETWGEVGRGTCLMLPIMAGCRSGVVGKE